MTDILSGTRTIHQTRCNSRGGRSPLNFEDLDPFSRQPAPQRALLTPHSSVKRPIASGTCDKVSSMNDPYASAAIAHRIDAHVEDGVMFCRLPGAIHRDAEVIWTLHRGDFNPRRASAPVVAGGAWQVSLPDFTNGYAVRATVDGMTFQSEWFQHFSSVTVRRYHEWRAEGATQSDDEIQPIPLFRYEAPFDTMGFVCHQPELALDELKLLASSNGLIAEQHAGVHWPRLTVITGNGASVDGQGTHFAFSGITRIADQLILGAPDVAMCVPNVRQMRDEIGEFHLLTWNESTITFEHDYIGQGHLFYFESDDLFVAANGLHMLVLMLRALGVTLSIETSVAKSKFFSTSYPFEFQHGNQTDFAQIRRVSVYDRVEIADDGVHFEKTEMWRDDLDGDLPDDLYEKLVAQAGQEIIDNVRVALADPRFENVVFELSAGLDSRIIYSALTHLAPSPKVRISTRRGPEERVAAEINNLYGFAWDDLPKRWSYDEGAGVRGKPATSHSVFMDGYYIESMFKPRSNYVDPTLIITGHGGEAFSRVMSVEGYFARDLRGELPQTVRKVEDVLAGVIRYIGNHQIWLEAGKKHFPAILSESLSASPSESFAKKFEDLYVSERNTYVCGSVFRGSMTGPQWRPLQSKALFRLKALWFQHRQDYRLQFDLIRSLNPLVSEAPYIKPIEVARKREFHNYRPPFRIDSPIAFTDNVESLNRARSDASARSSWVPSRTEFDAVRSLVREYEDNIDSFLEPLRQILTLSPEFDDMGLPLFAYVERFVNRIDPNSFSKRHNVRNKLHILLQEILLTSEPRDTA